MNQHTRLQGQRQRLRRAADQRIDGIAHSEQKQYVKREHGQRQTAKTAPGQRAGRHHRLAPPTRPPRRRQ